jgi:hypothetical protein
MSRPRARPLSHARIAFDLEADRSKPIRVRMAVGGTDALSRRELPGVAMDHTMV